MKIKPFFYLLFAFVVFSCSTGKKALQKGDYFSAVNKAVERLKTDPDNAKASKVLRDGYPVTIKWVQEEMDFLFSSNQPFKWENALNLMHEVNHISKLIRSTPAARNLIQNPKTYTSEINMAEEKAANERYNLGEDFLKKNTIEDARQAFEHFSVTNKLVPGYKNVHEKIEAAKKMATLNVIVEAVTVHSRKYRLSSEFFYDQVFEFLNHEFPHEGFVNFLSPNQAEKFNVNHPDFIVRMEFYDFTVGNIKQHVQEEELIKRIKKETKDSTLVEYKTYKAKLKTFTDEVISGGRLELRIVDFNHNEIARDKLIPGSFTWVNQYAIYVGDAEALDKNQFELTKKRALPIPAQQNLFIEFTKPIYEQLTVELRQFFRKYR